MFDALNHCATAANNAVDTGVSCDGTWQRRGISSLNGVFRTISIDSGKVLDVEPMRRSCKSCFLQRVLMKTDLLVVLNGEIVIYVNITTQVLPVAWSEEELSVSIFVTWSFQVMEIVKDLLMLKTLILISKLKSQNSLAIIRNVLAHDCEFFL